MIVERFPELLTLPLDEKRLLIEELCEEISPSSPPDPAIVEILESRWKKYEDDPAGAITLEDFKKRFEIS